MMIEAMILAILGMLLVGICGWLHSKVLHLEERLERVQFDSTMNYRRIIDIEDRQDGEFVDGFEPYTEGWEDDPDNINELIDEYQFHPVEWNEDAEEFEHLGDDKKPASINGVSKKQRDEEIEIIDEEE